MEPEQVASVGGSTSYESVAAKLAAAPAQPPKEPLPYVLDLTRYADFPQHIFLQVGATWPPGSTSGGAVNEIKLVDTNGAYVSLADMALHANQPPTTMLTNLEGGPNQGRLAIHVAFADIAAAFGRPARDVLRTLADKFPSAIVYREGDPPKKS